MESVVGNPRIDRALTKREHHNHLLRLKPDLQPSSGDPVKPSNIVGRRQMQKDAGEGKLRSKNPAEAVITGEGKLHPAKAVKRKGPYSPSLASAGTYEAEELRYSNGESRSHHGLVV